MSVKDFLVTHNLYQRFERDFVNYCMTFSLWYVNTLTGESQKLLFNKLQQEWFKEFAVTEFGGDYFYDQAAWVKFNHRMHCTYEQYIQLLSLKG
ncbi:MAG: hypothetical protein HUJ84_06985 [Veillonella sp.]|nr:hypothetical protein [Veillonella sp.]